MIEPARHRFSKEPYWLPQARILRSEGLTLKEIGKIIGRSAPAVYFAVSGIKKKNHYDPTKPRPKQARANSDRWILRASARDEAKRTGEDVEAIYDRLGVSTIDRSAAWDARRRSTAGMRR